MLENLKKHWDKIAMGALALVAIFVVVNKESAPERRGRPKMKD